MKHRQLILWNLLAKKFNPRFLQQFLKIFVNEEALHCVFMTSLEAINYQKSSILAIKMLSLV